MRPYATTKQIIAGILLISHGLMSCSNPQLPQRDFPDNNLIIEASDAPSNASLNQEGAELPNLLEESNEATINAPFEKQPVLNSLAVETALPDPGLEDINTTLSESNIPEGKREINRPVVLGGKQEFQDNKLIINDSNAFLKPSSKQEEAELPTLVEESNQANVNASFDKQSAIDTAALETALPDPGSGDMDTTLSEDNIPEGKREIEPAVVLRDNQAYSNQPNPWVQRSRDSSIIRDNNNSKQEAIKSLSNPPNQTATIETDPARMDLASAILSTTGAEPDIRLNTYYRLASKLEKHLQADKTLAGGWNLLWQKAQEPELLVNKEAYYKQDKKETFERLEAAIEEIKDFKVKLTTYGAASLEWQKDLEGLIAFYEQFKEKLIQAYLGVQDHFELPNLLKPKAMLMWEGAPEAYYRIDQAMARHLLAKEEARNRKLEEKEEATSNPYVRFLPLGSPLTAKVYFKNDGMPHLNPSREYMLYSLYKRLDIAVPASGLLVIDHVRFGEKYNDEPFFLQASQAIPGIRAKSPLKDNIEVDLDIDHFSKQVLGALLSAPVDGKPHNFVLTDLNNKKKGLVSIDNDEVFQSPLEKERVHLKSVLFFLPSMKEVISKGVDVMLRQLPISWLVLEWLDALKSQEARYQRLQASLVRHVSNDKLVRKGGKLAGNHIEERWQELSLPFLDFQSSIIPTVSHLLAKMEAYLRERRTATLEDLFQVCYPTISMYYQLLKEQASNKPYKALELLYGYDPQPPTLQELVPLHLHSDNNNEAVSKEGEYFQEEKQEGKQSIEQVLAVYKQENEVTLDQVMAYYLSLFKNEVSDIKAAIDSLQVLIRHGYEEVMDSKAAVALYVKGLGMAQVVQQEKEWQAIFKQLRAVNPSLSWLLTLEEHFPQGWNLEGKYKEPQHPQEIRGASIGRRHLTKEMEAVLLGKNGEFIADKSLSGRSMTNFYPKEKPLFYFKKYPELPAYEYGVTSFMRQLGMSQVPRSELFSFCNKEEGLYPVLVSQAIPGEPVYKVWEDDSRFSKLDPLYTSKLLIASMLLNPEDSKEDNFILSPDNKYLIPIDNDHAFLPGAIEEKGKFKVYPQLQTKTLAFCLKEMQQPLPSELIAELTSRNIELFLETWIKELIQIQGQYQSLLPEEKLASLWKEKGVSMHMPLSPLYIEGLYRKFYLLKTLLTQNPGIKPLAILKRLEPYVGSKYEQVMGLPSLKARFQGVSEVYKQTSARGARLAVANSQRLMEIMEIPDSVLMASPVVFTKGPEAALDQLKKLYKDKGVHSDRLQDLLRGPIESTKRLDQEGERQLIRQWFKSQEAYDWIMLHESSQLKEKHLTSFNFQSKGHLLSALDLRGAKELKESSFMALHTYCPNLVYLNISGWPLEKLGCFKPSGLLGGLELYQEPIFPSLQRLIIEGCKELKEINLALDSLESLEAKDNQALKKLRLTVPPIKYIDISGHQASEEDQATWFENIQFNSVPTIKGLVFKKR